MSSDPQRVKRLVLLFGALLVIGLLRPFWGPRYDLFVSEFVSSQHKNLQRIDGHIQAIGPRWKDFTNQNAGFELVSLFAYTGNDGVFAASGYVPSKDHLAKLTSFMKWTHPPRPVFVDALVVDDMLFEDLKKQLKSKHQPGPATESQPIRSETNRMPPAAGPRQ